MVTLVPALPLLAVLLQTPTDRVILHTEVIRHAAVAPADLVLARQVATSVLVFAGIPIDWHDVDALAPGEPPPSSALSMDVRLMPLRKSGHSEVSGDAVREPGRALPVVLIYLGTLDDQLPRFRAGPLRSNPLITSLKRGHLIGLTIAHEIGHAFGLHHAPRGVMKSLLDDEDILALRQSRLTFLGVESARLQAALALAWREVHPATAPTSYARATHSPVVVGHDDVARPMIHVAHDNPSRVWRYGEHARRRVASRGDRERKAAQ